MSRAPSFWLAADRTSFRLGDTVATESGEGPVVAASAAGWPVVELRAGRQAVRPYDVITRVRRGSDTRG
jgi:hypothetical protein